MSLLKSTTRRVALLTSSSLAVAAAASIGAALTPTAAAAQATCVSTPAPAGNGGNTVTYPTGTYDPSINCTYVGTAATVSTTGSITVSATAPGGGINLTGTGANAVKWNSTAGTVTAGAQVNGPVIDAATDSGAINIDVSAINGPNPTVTHGIRAISNTGAIAITRTGVIGTNSAAIGNIGIEARSGGAVSVTGAGPARGRLSGILTGYGIRAASTGGGDVTVAGGAIAEGDGGVGIEAISTGGNGNVSIDTSGASGGGYGVLARASGTGTLTIVGTANVLGAGIAAIDATTGTGFLTITGTVQGQSGIGVRTNTGGGALLTLTSVAGGGAGNGVPTLDITTGGTTTINAGSITAGPSDNWGSMAILARGAGGVIATVSSGLTGRVDFSGLVQGGDVSVTGGTFRTQGASVFSPGNDTLSIGSDARWFARTAVMDFGDGDNSVSSAGMFVVNATASTLRGETRLIGLTTFENSGLIAFGNGVRPEDGAIIATESDHLADDVLSMEGATFIGSGDSRLILDVNLNGIGQNACDTSVRDSIGNLLGGDCLNLTGGATQGVTAVTIFDLLPGDRGAYNPDGTVLVDVSGGTSGHGHFVLDPTSSQYSTAYGGSVDKGLFFFTIVYDESTQQHKLVGLPTANALQLPLMAHAAQDLWRVSAGSWLSRQADMRGDIDEGIGGGVWLRLTGENSDREAIQSVTGGGNTFRLDNSFRQKSYAVTGGVDVMSGSRGDTAYVVGLTAGYAHADVEYDTSPNIGRFDGWTGGGYASFLSGGFFVDALVSASKLVMDDDVPAFDLFPAGAILSTNVLGVGAQLETGWRIPVLGEGLFVEPLAGASYVRTTFDEMQIVPEDAARTGATVEFEDSASLRANLGARLSLDQDYGSFLGQYSVLARVSEELEGESTVILHNLGPDATLSNEFSGRLTEVGLAVGVHSSGGLVSGFLNLGGKFGDDYEARAASAGLRVAF